MPGPERTRSLIETLSRTPEHTWPDGVLYHGARILLLVASVLIIQLLFPISPVPDFPNLEKGMVHNQDVIADVGFLIPKTDAELSQERDDAAAAVAPVYRYNPGAVDTMIGRVTSFLARLDSAALRARTPEEQRSNISRTLTSLGFPVSEESIQLLSDDANRQALARSLESVIRNELPAGIVASAEDLRSPQWRIVRGAASSWWRVTRC